MRTKTVKIAGKSYQFEVEPTLIGVRFQEPAPYSWRVEASDIQGLQPFETRFEPKGEKFTLLNVSEFGGNIQEIAIHELSANKVIERITEVFKVGETRFMATDRILFRFVEDDDHPFPPNWPQLPFVSFENDGNFWTGILEPAADSFEIADQLHQMAEIEYAEPDFMVMRPNKFQLSSTIDPKRTTPLQHNQYALKKMQVLWAHELQVGKPEIKIAILDSGVQTTHEDLKATIAGTYDAEDNDCSQEPNPWDTHGTACAGLAAATANNNLGIRGTGAGCSLIAIRVYQTTKKGQRFGTTTSRKVALGIDKAVHLNADILSMSWEFPPSTTLESTILNAVSGGRNGKGCVFLASAGNNFINKVAFPASLKETIAVSASNQCDEPKTRQSVDGEKWWGSNFGPEIDVAAPGVKNITTTNYGAPGAINGKYDPNFYGTSSSAPLVAGVAGLILSANPDLTWSQVRAILRDSADKVGSIPYTNGRNDHMGYGRVNALRAVQMAQNMA